MRAGKGAPAVRAGDDSAHLQENQITAYAQGSLPAACFMVVERHLDRCADCRGLLSRGLPQDWAEARWQRLSGELDSPSRSLAERILLRLGVPDHMARLAMATPVLRRSWLVASVVTLLFTVVAARLSPGASATLLLLAAPLIPSAGVALSYGPAFDPMYELSLVMPTHSLRLILFRSITVLLASTALSALMTLALPVQGLVVFGWLAPSLAVTCLTLALSAFLDPTVAAWAVGAGWLVAALLAGQGSATGSLLLTVPGQGVVALLALTAAGFIAAQRHRFEQGSRWHPDRLTA